MYWLKEKRMSVSLILFFYTRFKMNKNVCKLFLHCSSLLGRVCHLCSHCHIYKKNASEGIYIVPGSWNVS